MPSIRSAILFLLLPASFAAGSGPDAYRPRVVDWADPVFVPAFPADQPPPQAVILRYQRWSSASGSVENMEDHACGVLFTHHVRLELSLLGGRILDVSTREGNEARLLGEYDGVEDYGGTSGATLWSSGGETTTLVLDDPADIAYFAGSEGSVELGIRATGEAGFTGVESLRQRTEVRAGVRVTVAYLPARN